MQRKRGPSPEQRAARTQRLFAAQAYRTRAARREIEHIVRTVEKVETAVEPKFQQHFVEAIAVPHKTAQYPNLEGHVTLPPVAAAAPGDEPQGRRRRRRSRAG